MEKVETMKVCQRVIVNTKPHHCQGKILLFHKHQNMANMIVIAFNEFFWEFVHKQNGCTFLNKIDPIWI